MEKHFPLFPLSLIVFPQERLKLHIFEPRYRQLIHECLEDGITFGIPAVIEKNVVEVATEVKLLAVEKKYKGGELDIVTEGVRRVRINKFFREAHAKPYPGGLVDFLEDDNEAEPDTQQKIFELMHQLHEALGIQKQAETGDGKIYSYSIGHNVGFNLEQEYELLSLDTESDRLSFILNHLEHILPVVLETERLKAKAKLNGHFKNVLPPDF
jgi:Lon protease-like protein